MPSPSPPILPPGSRLAGYQIDALVGRGGMGEVFRATQLSMDRVVALKVLAPRLAKDPAFAEQFVAEARAAGQLNHPNIVAVHDVGQAPAPEGCHEAAAGEPVHYFSMEFIDGETVKDVIDRQGAVDLPTVGKVMLAMAEALGFAEAHKIVHRDIKPDNIMLTGAGLVKLADLGLALQADSAEAVAGSKDEQGRGKVMGTPLYMAPEQARAQPLDHRADQYALGATLFHMLTGRPPFQGDSAKAIMRAHCFEPVPDPVEVNPQVPAIWRELCQRMMAKAPDERFAGAADLRVAVKSAVRWKPGMAPRLRTARRGGSWPLIALGAAAVIALAVIGLMVSGGNRPAAPAPDATPPPPTPVRDPVAEAKEKAARALAALPGDLDAALELVQKMHDDPAFAPARAEIALRRDALRGAKEERRRAPLRQQVEQATQHANAGQLAEARQALAGLPAEDWLQPLRRDAEAAIERAEDLLERQLGEAIGTAEDLRACNQLGERIRGSALGETRQKRLLGQLNRQRQALQAAQQAAKPKPVDTAALWRQAGEKLDPLRATLPYNALADAARAIARDFPEAERPQIEAIATAAELAGEAEIALRLHIGQARPVLACRFAGRSGTWRLTALDKDSIRYGLPDLPAGGSSIPRAAAEVPWGEILPAALAAKNLRDPRIEAAFLWYWRHPGTAAALKRLPDDPLAAALAAYELRTRPLLVAGTLQRLPDGLVQVAYPFAETRDAALLGDWQGEGHALAERGLHWSTTRPTAEGVFLEAELPTLRWRQGLRPPVELETVVHPDTDSELLFVGLSSPRMHIRIAINHKQRKAFILASRPDDPTRYRVMGNTSPVSYPGLEPVRLRLSVATDGKATLRLNDSALPDDPILAFPADAVLTPVVQGRPLKTSAGLTIRELTVSGRP